MDTIDELKYFGLTGQEATIYVCLLSQEQMTGYEAAKETGISRSNTYTALAGLVDKGAAYVMEGKVTTYTAVPIGEFCHNRLHKLEQLRDDLVRHLPAKKLPVEGYITITGEEKIMQQMRNMIDEAEARIYVAAAPKVLRGIRPELERAVGRGLKVVVIDSDGFELEGAILYRAKYETDQIRLITDSSRVLTGELAGDPPICLYSGKENLVVLFKEALKNEITLIQLTGSETGR